MRSDSSSNSSIDPGTIIAGAVVAAAIVVGVAIWMGLRLYRKRMAAKREAERGAAFLSIKGVVRDDVEGNDEKNGSLQRSVTRGGGFSRNNLDSSIVLPEKALNPPASRQSIIEYHRQSGSFPKPFSFALGAGSPRNSAADMENSKPRNSWMSFSSGSQSRFSVMSGTSSFDVTTTSGTTRKVRQTFDPVLPDELLIHAGEQLTLVQSFDDGWCVVGREGSLLVHTAKSLFKPTSQPEDNIELGVVPAWCFLKSVKGLRAERPIRSSSLGITVNLDAPASSSRGELLSWSNF
ncbi:hypothetical protein CPB84DRAFT_1680794 [Gymnopilus junonius]|uniref:SH3 domain-containing protein n=1 Tax=Gymnopilus junonius TaxID=109634 RepID=A0A9P5TLU9_GYMJU|nr:hypothetical protein CPB84DRAFT_1680794 [Gymnopilus junonius]